MNGPVDAALLRRTPTDLLSLLTGTIEALREQATALDVDLSIDAAVGLPPLDIDGEKIAWAIVTLLRNAFRYAGHAAGRLSGGSIRVQLRAEGDWVVMSVEDDGLGVPADEAAKMFPGGRGLTHGSGLGLTLIQDVVGAHGGTVDFESTPEALVRGTAVTLRLPTSANSRAAPAA